MLGVRALGQGKEKTSTVCNCTKENKMKQVFKDPWSYYPKANPANQYHPLTAYHLPCYGEMWLNRPVPYDCCWLIFSRLGQSRAFTCNTQNSKSVCASLHTSPPSTAVDLGLLFWLSRLPLLAPQLN